MAKKTTRQLAKEKAWKEFSIYIRTRDCLRFSGTPHEGRCITCWKPFDFKQLQAGHFVGGRGNAVLFDERLVHSQCFYCNAKPPRGLDGNYAEYMLFMIREVGLEQAEAYLRIKGTTKVYKEHDFVELRDEFKRKTRLLLDKA